MTDIKLSIIVPVYNKEKHLQGLCEELISLDNADIEYIFIDDGSTDYSLAILNRYKNDKRVNIISTSNHGVSGARNIGIQNSRGKYITFIDADDRIDVEAFKKAIECLVSEKDIYIFPIYLQNSNESYFIQPDIRDMNTQDFCEYCVVNDTMNYCCSRFIKNNIVRENKIFFPEGITIGEDKIFVFRLVKYIKEYELCDVTFYKYYMNDDGAMNKKHLRRFHDNISLFEESLNLIDRDKAVEIAFKRFRKNLVHALKNDGYRLTCDAVMNEEIQQYIQNLARESKKRHFSKVLVELGWIKLMTILYFINVKISGLKKR